MSQSDLLKEKVANFTYEFLCDEIKASMHDNELLIWLGIGSGTTIKFFISLLGKKFIEDSIPFKFVTVSSSADSESMCRKLNLPIRQLTDLSEGKKLDYYIDGADEIDNNKRCLKGLGGASTREKLLRIESKKFFVLGDVTKQVTNLCTKNPVVLEILPFGYEKTLERIQKLNPAPIKVEMRKGTGKMGFVITDNNNYLVDVYFTNLFNESFDFENFELQLKTISGVVESGLFSIPADRVFIATSKTIEVLK